MSKSGVQGNFYLGIVADIVEEGDIKKTYHQIKADIPGIICGVNAFPLRGDCDEPKKGDPIILLGLDPDYNSYYLYWKLKENDFTGFRAYGKEISIEEDKLVIRSYSEGEYKDGEHEPGEENSRIELDDKGNITIIANKDANVEIKNNANITVGNEAKIDATVATIKTVDAEIGAGDEGLGTLTIAAQGVIPDAAGGPFVALPPGAPVTPPQGAPFPCGNTIILKKL